MFTTHTNSEGERIGIEPIEKGPFAGQHLIVIFDDPPPKGSGKSAPMLLDLSTVFWLKQSLNQIIGEMQSNV